MVKYKVAVCAGHGGNNSTPGKRTPDGEYEWNFNDKVIRAGIALLEKNGVEVLRTDDASGKTDVGLTTRTNKANAWGADVYWSSHHNALTGKWMDQGIGIETFTQVGSHPEAEKLARIVHPKYVEVMGLKDRGVKKLNLAITRQTKMPAILTEGGFMDSRVDVKIMRNDAKLKAQGEAIAEGILEYLGAKDIERPNSTTPPKQPTPKPAGSPGVVDWMIANKMDSSYSNRAKLAKKYGIGGYKGTASQNTALLAKLKSGNKPNMNKPSTSNKGNKKTTSIVDYLNSIKVDSSPTNRRKLAKKYGVNNYDLSAKKNTELLNKMRKGKPSVTKPSAPSVTKKTSSSNYKVGQNIRIKTSAKKYSRASIDIPSKHKNKGYTIQQVGKDDVLIKELVSWVKKSDLQESVNTVAPGKTASKSKSYKTGQKIKIKPSAKTYATGEAIPSRFKNKTYTIQQVGRDRVLVKELFSWVRNSDVQ